MPVVGHMGNLESYLKLPSKYKNFRACMLLEKYERVAGWGSCAEVVGVVQVTSESWLTPSQDLRLGQ